MRRGVEGGGCEERSSREPRGVGMKCRVIPEGRVGSSFGAGGRENRRVCRSDILDTVECAMELV